VPSARPLTGSSELQAVQEPPSRRHWSELPGSPLSVGLREVEEVVPVGMPVAVGARFGGVRSTSQLRVVTGPVLPAGSVERTRKLWPPSARPVRETGLVQDVHTAPSSEHS